jgi:hypothetical protein
MVAGLVKHYHFPDGKIKGESKRWVEDVVHKCTSSYGYLARNISDFLGLDTFAHVCTNGRLHDPLTVSTRVRGNIGDFGILDEVDSKVTS